MPCHGTPQMNCLPPDQLARIAACACEGVGLNATARLNDVSENAVARNLLWIGEACQAYHDKHDINLPCRTVEADELFSILYAREKNLPVHLKSSLVHGELATWLGIDPVSKFVISWYVGKHAAGDAETFCFDLRARLGIARPQIFTDGLLHYRVALEAAFGDSLDYATINKVRGVSDWFAERLQQPPIEGMRRAARVGTPNMDEVSTTSVERLNLALRMTSSRYRRFSNTISKKIRHKRAALALRFVYENYARIHESIRVTPAMELGVADHVWEIEDIVALAPARPANRPKTYRKRAAAN